MPATSARRQWSARRKRQFSGRLRRARVDAAWQASSAEVNVNVSRKVRSTMVYVMHMNCLYEHILARTHTETDSRVRGYGYGWMNGCV